MEKKLGQQGQSDQTPNVAVEEKPVGNADLFRTINADEWHRIQAEFLGQQAQKESEKDLSFTDLPLEDMVAEVAKQKEAAEVRSQSASLQSQLTQSGVHPERDSNDQIREVDALVDVGYTFNKNYELLKLLGEGATGRVFLAEHHRWRTRYAIKVLHSWVSRQEALMRLFRTSFQKLETLRQENIVRPFMLDFDSQSESVFYFMDYVEGETLVTTLSRRHKRDSGPPFSRDEILQLLETLAAAINVAHKHSYYAGNIQPSRIIMPTEDDAPPQLLSLGLMPTLHQGGSPLQSGPLHAMYYAAPELKMGKSSVTAAADVFSLGVMTYQLLTGSLPVGIARPPSEVSARWPKSLDRVMSRAMQAEPTERYSSIDAFLDEFKSAFKARPNTVQISLSGESPSVEVQAPGGFQPVVASSANVSLPNKRNPVASKRRAETPSARYSTAGTGSRIMNAPRPPNAGGTRSNPTSGGPTRRAPASTTGVRKPPSTGTRKPPSKRFSGGSARDRADATTRPPLRPTSNRTSAPPSRVMSPPSRVMQSPPSRPAGSPSRIMGAPAVHNPNAPISTWPAHEQSISSMALSPDGKLLASAGEDNTLRLWATGSWSQLQTLQVRSNRILNLRWSFDSRYIAFVGEENAVQVWDTRTMRQEHKLPHQTKVHDLAWHSNGHLLYTACANRQIFSWNLRLQRINGTLEGHEAAVRSLLYDQNSNMLVSGGEDNQIKMWSVERKDLFQNLCSSTSPVFAMALSGASSVLATGHADNLIQMRDFRSGHLKCSLRGHEDPIACLLFGPNDRWLASGSMDETIRIWDSRKSRLIHTIDHHKSPVHSICLSKDGHWLATASNENDICIWDASKW